jgi:rhodanese-related sulfurtransferase
MIADIDRDELKQKLDHQKKSTLVEALLADQFRKVRLRGAINIPAHQVRSLAPDLLPNKDAEVIVYCAGPACHARGKPRMS